MSIFRIIRAHTSSTYQLHFLIKDVVGSNYFFEANVKHALAADLHRTKLAGTFVPDVYVLPALIARIVDLGCGTGAWYVPTSVCGSVPLTMRLAQAARDGGRVS
jgi:hypothetical protein